MTTVDDSYVCGVSVTHGAAPRNHIWTFSCGETEANPAWSSVCPCDASVPIKYSLHSLAKITSVSRESMSHGITAGTIYSIQMILYGMEGAEFPAANVAHNIIHRIIDKS